MKIMSMDKAICLPIEHTRNLAVDDSARTEKIKEFYCDKFPLKVSLINAPESPEKLIAANYLTCIEGHMVYPSELSDIKAEDIVKWVIKGGHTPALECIHLTFAITDASVVLLKQISRHRIGNSLGVMTQRANSEEWLGNMAANGHYVTPPSISDNPKVFDAYEQLVFQSQQFYRLAIKEGVQQDEARYGIVQGATTMWQATYSYKTLLDSICSTRLCHIMQGEMVAMAQLIKHAVGWWNPMLGDALRPICFRTGFCNRNENNPTAAFPKGACEYTKDGVIPVRNCDATMDLTKYSKDATV